MTFPIRPTAKVALLLIAVALTASETAGAQEIPEGQSCGGLVCDLGLFGHKVAPKPASVAPAAAPAPAAPPPIERSSHIATSEPKADVPNTQKHQPARKKTGLAKASMPPQPRPVASPVLGEPPVSAELTPPPVASVAPARPQIASVPKPAAAAPTAVPAPAASKSSPIDAILGPTPDTVSLTQVQAAAALMPEEPVVLANPYVSAQPLRPRFQSVDPTAP